MNMSVHFILAPNLIVFKALYWDQANSLSTSFSTFYVFSFTSIIVLNVYKHFCYGTHF